MNLFGRSHASPTASPADAHERGHDDLLVDGREVDELFVGGTALGAVNVDGGMLSWSRAGLPVVTGP